MRAMACALTGQHCDSEADLMYVPHDDAVTKGIPLDSRYVKCELRVRDGQCCAVSHGSHDLQPQNYNWCIDYPYKLIGDGGMRTSTGGWVNLELKTNAELKAAIDNGMAGIALWDVSRIEDFSGAFNLWDRGRNADLALRTLQIQDWDVSNGKNFYQMFAGATEFNGDLSEWDVSKGRNFDQMFYRASAFDGDLGGWDLSQGTSFENMFKDADACGNDACGVCSLLWCHQLRQLAPGTCSLVTRCGN